MSESEGRRKTSPPPKKRDVRKKAELIVTESGIPLAEAMKVASGKETLSQVLKRLKRKEEIRLNVAQGLLHKRHVSCINKGILSMEDALMLTRLGTRKKEPDYFLCHLEEYHARGEEVTLALVQNRLLTGLLTSESPFEVGLATRDGKNHQISKHNIKFFCLARDKKGVLKGLERNPDAPSIPEDHLSKRTHRQDIRARHLLKAQEQNLNRTWITQEGDVLRGKVTWFGRFEIRIQTTRGCEVILMRHALSQLIT